MMFGIVSQMQNAFGMEQLETEPGRERGTTSCNRSGLCCWKRPGRLTREDLSRLASLRGVSERAFFTGWCAVDDVGGLCVILRRRHQRGGEWITAAESYSLETPCVLFDDVTRTCEVYLIKPAECARHQCWVKQTDAFLVEWTRQQILDLGWSGCQDDD